jgi:Protein of unknown function (DUF1631)
MHGDSEQPKMGAGFSQAESRLHAAELRAFMLRATVQVEQAVFPLLDGLLYDLQTRIERSRSNGERQQLSDAFVALHKRKPTVQAQFSKYLREFVEAEISKDPSSQQSYSTAKINYQSLELVDDDLMAEEIEAKKTALKIDTSSEWELREVTALINALQELEELDVERNPLRPDVLSKALYRAMKSSADDSQTRRILVNSMGDALAKAMPGCYQKIAAELKKRNIKPLEYVARTSLGSGSMMGMDAGDQPARPLEQALLNEMTQEAQIHATMTLTESLQSTISTVFGLISQLGVPAQASLNSGQAIAPGKGSSARVDAFYDSGYNSHAGPRSRGGTPSQQGPDSIRGWYSSQGTPSRRGPHSRLSDLLMDLRGTVWGAPTDVRSVSVRNARGFGDSGFADSVRNARSFASTETHRPSAFGPVSEGAMLNPVKAHLRQLQEATQEPFRMTIEIVAQVFDAILGDKFLQPLAARLIARLQLPLLDVALSDANLFARADHPLHALVNRLGATAIAFDVYESGPGQRFYAAALTVVEGILDSDFKALETYRTALDKLNAFVKHEGQPDNPFHADAAHILAIKEQAWQLEHHLSAQVTPVIEGMPIPTFLRDFFLQTWVRTQVEAVLRYGEKSPESHRFSRMCSDLVWSVIPKVTNEEKRQLVAALPHLMRDVNDAFSMLKWPALAQKDFRSKLIDHQARAMKWGEAAPDSASLPIPALPTPESGQAAIAQLKGMTVPTLEEMQASMMGMHELAESRLNFTDVERIVTGFMSDDAVQQAASSDVPLFEQASSSTGQAPTSPPPALDQEISLQQSRSMQTGDAYDICIAGVWRKYRLAWVSDLRGIYLFEDCKDVKSKLSLTAHTVMGLWQRDHIRPFEKQALMSRAIEATRLKLLAAHT